MQSKFMDAIEEEKNQYNKDRKYKFNRQKREKFNTQGYINGNGDDFSTARNKIQLVENCQC